MTAQLFKSTTDDLIEELESAAKLATNDLWTTDGHSMVVAWSDQANQCYAVAKCEGPDRIANAPYIAVANPANVLDLIAELRSLRADAERYRWLRADRMSSFDFDLNEPQLVFVAHVTGDWQDTIDDAIDTAMQAQKCSQ